MDDPFIDSVNQLFIVSRLPDGKKQECKWGELLEQWYSKEEFAKLFCISPDSVSLCFSELITARALAKCPLSANHLVTIEFPIENLTCNVTINSTGHILHVTKLLSTTSPLVYVLSGCKGSGKDTASNILEAHWHALGLRVGRFAFADALREVCSIVFGYSPDDFMQYDRKEFVKSPILGDEWTPRRALQCVGTDLFRKQIHPEVWVRIGIDKIRGMVQSGDYDVVIVTDARFENEMRALQLFEHRRFVYVVRPAHMPRTCAHESEAFVQDLERHLHGHQLSAGACVSELFDFDFVVHNFEDELDAFREHLIRTC